MNMKNDIKSWKFFIIIFFVTFINPVSSQTADELFVEGKVLLIGGEFGESIKAFDSAIAIDSGYKEAWLYKGHALYNLGQYRRAVEAYDRALAIDPKLKDAWLNKGAVLDTLGDYNKAKEAFDKAIIIDPNYKEAWLGRGIVLNNLGEYKKANEAFDKAIAIDPYLESVWAYKGIALYGMGEYEKSVEALDRSIAIDPYVKEIKELRELAIRKMAEQTATPAIEDNKLIMIGGIGVFILIGIIAYRYRRMNESKSEAASQVEEESVKGKIGVYKVSDFVFGYSDAGWLKTALMSLFLGVLIIILFIPDTDRSGLDNRWIVIAIGYPAWWAARKLYWDYRFKQIVDIIVSRGDPNAHLDSLLENNQQLYLKAHSYTLYNGDS